LSADDPVEMSAAVTELVSAILDRNELSPEDLISIVLTATPDLVSAFPAAAARSLGLGDVPLLCAQEMDVAGALSRVIRVMATVETDRARRDMVHVYQRGAQVLRQDLAQ
jgi:chorismate mutase